MKKNKELPTAYVDGYRAVYSGYESLHLLNNKEGNNKFKVYYVERGSHSLGHVYCWAKNKNQAIELVKKWMNANNIRLEDENKDIWIED